MPRRLISISILLAFLGLAPRLPAHVGLTGPEGGRVLTPGEEVTVSWIVLVAHDTIAWSLYYSLADDEVWFPILEDGPPGDTSEGAVHEHVWVVPNVTSNQVRLRIVQVNDVFEDLEDRTDVPMAIVDPTGPPLFVRGDCNDDASHDVADPIFLLHSLFASGPPPVCQDACDANDDGQVDIADAVFTLAHLFTGGAEFPPPFPNCGQDTAGPGCAGAGASCP